MISLLATGGTTPIVAFMALTWTNLPDQTQGRWAYLRPSVRMMAAACVRLVTIALVSCSIASAAHAGSVAITFDDLPIFGLKAWPPEAEVITSKLLDGFKKHRWIVTGFVNEIQLAGSDRAWQTALLKKWLDAGMDLGNHSYSHLSLTKTPVDAYIADVERGVLSD